MLGTSEGSFYLLSKLWKKSPQTGFSGHGHEHFFVQSRAEEWTLRSCYLSIETGRQMTEFLREHGLHPIILKNSMS